MLWPVLGMVIGMLVGPPVHRDAKKRGMSGPGWGLFAWALPIVAVPIYLAVRKPVLPAPPSPAGAQQT